MQRALGLRDRFVNPFIGLYVTAHDGERRWAPDANGMSLQSILVLHTPSFASYPPLLRSRSCASAIMGIKYRIIFNPTGSDSFLKRYAHCHRRAAELQWRGSMHWKITQKLNWPEI